MRAGASSVNPTVRESLPVTPHRPTVCGAPLAEGGRITSPPSAAGMGVGRINLMLTPTGQLLARVAAHLADGTITHR